MNFAACLMLAKFTSEVGPFPWTTDFPGEEECERGAKMADGRRGVWPLPIILLGF